MNKIIIIDPCYLTREIDGKSYIPYLPISISGTGIGDGRFALSTHKKSIMKIKGQADVDSGTLAIYYYDRSGIGVTKEQIKYKNCHIEVEINKHLDPSFLSLREDRKKGVCYLYHHNEKIGKIA